jgi:hypothetical protein
MTTLGWQNFKTLNMCHQTYQITWFVAPLVRVVLSKRIPKRSKLDWFANEQHIHEMLDFHVQNFKG